MTDEDDRLCLSEALKNLEIVAASVGVTNGKNIDRNIIEILNPFSYDTCEVDLEGETRKIFGPKCECLQRKGKSFEHAIINRVQFKQKRNPRIYNSRSSNKLILREPILKCFDHCLHYNHVRHKKCERLTTKLLDCPTLDALNLEDSSSTKRDLHVEKENDKLLDFKALVEECDIISSNNFMWGSCGGNRYRNLKSFTTIQHNDKRLTNNNNCRKIKKSQLKVINAQSTKIAQNANANSSCSQQARINASSNCDVTIDELASYFETFVHIPKKMSTMAEMIKGGGSVRNLHVTSSGGHRFQEEHQKKFLHSNRPNSRGSKVNGNQPLFKIYVKT